MPAPKHNVEGLSFFLVTSASKISAIPADLSDVNGNSCRKRRRHVKTRSGCVACKKRRVKCDETYPSCRSCLKRKLPCSLSEAPSPISQGQQSPPHTYTLDLYTPRSTLLLPQCLDKMQMKLLKHFDAFTSYTLPYGSQVWHDSVYPLAFEHSFVMDMILLITARHLHHLHPEEPAYQRAAMFHLVKGLPEYRQEIERPPREETADALMAAGVLLYNYVWTTVDSVDLSTLAGYANDPMFSMAVGLREMFVRRLGVLHPDRSIFYTCMHYHSRIPIRRAARRCAKLPRQFEAYFSSQYHRLEAGKANHRDTSRDRNPYSIELDQLGADVMSSCLGLEPPTSTSGISAETEEMTQDPIFLGYLEAVSRAAPVISIAAQIEEQMSSESIIVKSEKPKRMVPGSDGGCCTPSNLIEPTPKGSDSDTSMPSIQDVSRYLFSWPVLCIPSFLELLEQRDHRALLLLYYYYKATRVVLPKEYWWAHQRAEWMEPVLEAELRRGSLVFNGYTTSCIIVSEQDIAFEVNAADQERNRWRNQGLDLLASRQLAAASN